jgi:hypothetical protein
MTDANEDDRPWEWPGAMRRDCVPHRSQFLHFLAVVSVVCSVLIIPVPVALCLGFYVTTLAREDLLRMQQGLMDSSGRLETEIARQLAWVALVWSVCLIVGCGGWATLPALTDVVRR